MKTPLISIIIPCYNMEPYIVEALESVLHQRAHIGDYECVVVNDGSTDHSAEVIDAFITSLEGPHPRFIALNTPNRGVADARNLAIGVAKGKWILPLDADDTLLPNAIEVFKKHIIIEPETALFVPGRVVIHPGGLTSTQARKWGGYKELMERCTPSNTSCFKKADWQRVGGYRNGTMYEDWEFWLRLLYGNDKVVNIPAELYTYRVRGDSRWHEAVKNHYDEIKKIKLMNPKIYGTV